MEIFSPGRTPGRNQELCAHLGAQIANDHREPINWLRRAFGSIMTKLRVHVSSIGNNRRADRNIAHNFRKCKEKISNVFQMRSINHDEPRMFIRRGLSFVAARCGPTGHDKLQSTNHKRFQVPRSPRRSSGGNAAKYRIETMPLDERTIEVPRLTDNCGEGYW